MAVSGNAIKHKLYYCVLSDSQMYLCGGSFMNRSYAGESVVRAPRMYATVHARSEIAFCTPTPGQDAMCSFVPGPVDAIEVGITTT